jgi:hypothetical protein
VQLIGRGSKDVHSGSTKYFFANDTMAKAVETATIHNGMFTGMIKGMSIPDTKTPSFTSCFRTWANANSIPSATTYETTTMGMNRIKPNQKRSNSVDSMPMSQIILINRDSSSQIGWLEP